MATEFWLNGEKIRSKSTFFKEFEKELIVDAEAVKYWSLDVFEDVLAGGYGVYEMAREIIIHWRSYERSQERMNKEDLSEILEIIEACKNIKLIKE